MLGADDAIRQKVFVGSGISSGDPAKRASAIVKAVTNFRNPQILAQISEDLGEAMVGINENEIQTLMAERPTKIKYWPWQGAFNMCWPQLGAESVEIRNLEDFQ